MDKVYEFAVPVLTVNLRVEDLFNLILSFTRINIILMIIALEIMFLAVTVNVDQR